MALEQKLQDAFDAVDTSDDHYIDWHELQDVCTKLEIELDESDMEMFLSCQSKNNRGLNFDEFYSFIQLRLKKIFQQIDINGNGFLDKFEIKAALEKLHINLTDRQIDGILQGMDTNNDFKIDFSEFCLFFADMPSPSLKSIAKRWSAGSGLDFGSDIVPTTMPPVETPLSQFMLAGGLAGVVSRTLTAPLEKIKILAQTSSGRTSITKLFTRILHVEGVRGLFSGNFTNCLRVFPTSSLVCLVYSQMIKYTPVDNVKNPNQPLWRFFAGATAGVVATAATHPLDVVRARLTVQDLSRKDTSNYSSITGALRRIHAEEGVRGLYKGLSPSLISIGPFLGVQQCVYDVVKLYALSSEFGASSSTFLVCGALSGMVAQTTVHPLDVVRRQMQVERGEQSVARSSLTALKVLWQNGGIRALYSGLVASYLKVMPAAATSLLVRDALLGRLKD